MNRLFKFIHRLFRADMTEVPIGNYVRSMAILHTPKNEGLISYLKRSLYRYFLNPSDSYSISVYNICANAFKESMHDMFGITDFSVFFFIDKGDTMQVIRYECDNNGYYDTHDTKNIAKYGDNEEFSSFCKLYGINFDVRGQVREINSILRPKDGNRNIDRLLVKSMSYGIGEEARRLYRKVLYS